MFIFDWVPDPVCLRKEEEIDLKLCPCHGTFYLPNNKRELCVMLPT